MSGHLYRAFGMVIRSELELPELLPSEGAPDLEIHFGRAPRVLADPTAEGDSFQASSRELLLSIEGVARFYAQDGGRVTIERSNGGAEIDLRAFLLGPVFAALLHQRGVLPLHASAIEAAGAAVLFVGPSGSGKSTLVAALASRGYQVVADDVAAVAVREGSSLVLPGFPQLKLWADAVERLGARTAELPRVDSVREKYGLAAKDSFHGDPLPLRRAYALDPVADATEVSLAPLRGAEKAVLLMANTYRQQFLGRGEEREPNFRQCTAVASCLELLRISRPASGDYVDALAGLVEKDLRRTT